MKLIVVYAILAAAGIAAAIGSVEVVEMTYPSASLISFMGLFFLMLGARAGRRRPRDRQLMS